MSAQQRCPQCGDKLSHGRPGDPRKAGMPACQREMANKARIRTARERTEMRRAERAAERLELERARATVPDASRPLNKAPVAPG